MIAPAQVSIGKCTPATVRFTAMRSASLRSRICRGWKSGKRPGCCSMKAFIITVTACASVACPLGNAPAAYHVIEAIVETDWWMGPLFTNFQFVKTDDPVRFESSRPWLQLVEVPRQVHLPRRGEHPTIVAIEGMSDATWSKFMETSDRRNSGRPGSYRLASKRMNSSESTVG